MEIAAARLRNSYQIVYVETNGIFVKQNTLCVIETPGGTDIGRISKSPGYNSNTAITANGKIVRKATVEDINKIPGIEDIERKAFKACREKAAGKNMSMKLIAVKALFDRSKIIFFFVSESRVDFRELVRELAGMYRTRIEMRQIGVRDEARYMGGYGPCGRNLCCIHQREDFEPVSIKMAKEQNLNLNSLKISGMCSRLLCCLSYEYDTYKWLNTNLPSVGTEIHAEDRTYTVINADTLKETIQIKADDRIIEISKYSLTRDKERYCIKKKLLNEILAAPGDPSTDENIFSFTV